MRNRYTELMVLISVMELGRARHRNLTGVSEDENGSVDFVIVSNSDL